MLEMPPQDVRSSNQAAMAEPARIALSEGHGFSRAVTSGANMGFSPLGKPFPFSLCLLPFVFSASSASSAVSFSVASAGRQPDATVLGKRLRSVLTNAWSARWETTSSGENPRRHAR